MAESPPISDIQYYVFACEVPVAVAAKRIGTSPAKLFEELARTPIPDWLLASAKRVMEGGSYETHVPDLHTAGGRRRRP